jgi:hypothetical protein
MSHFRRFLERRGIYRGHSLWKSIESSEIPLALEFYDLLQFVISQQLLHKVLQLLHYHCNRVKWYFTFDREERLGGGGEGKRNAIFSANGVVPSRDAGNDFTFKVEEEPE